MNSTVITIYDMMRASGKRDIKEIIVDANEQKIQQYQDESKSFSSVIQIPADLPEYTVKWLQKKNVQIQEAITAQSERLLKQCNTNHMKASKIIR